MSDYRRSREGRTFFFTVVTHERRPILTTDTGRNLLRSAIYTVKEERPFELVATVLLPDHIHVVWTLPQGDTDYSTRWRRKKSLFTQGWQAEGRLGGRKSESRLKRGEQGLWQRRFYEHTVRDETNLKRCVDYIHVNPLKHHLVERVRDWPWSSFHRYVRLGEYDPDWGNADFWFGEEFKHAE